MEHCVGTVLVRQTCWLQDFSFWDNSNSKAVPLYLNGTTQWISVGLPHLIGISGLATATRYNQFPHHLAYKTQQNHPFCAKGLSLMPRTTKTIHFYALKMEQLNSYLHISDNEVWLHPHFIIKISFLSNWYTRI